MIVRSVTGTGQFGNGNRTLTATRATLLSVALIWFAGWSVVAGEPSVARLSAYLHLDKCIDADASMQQRRQQLEQTVVAMRQAGLEAIVPYVSTTSGTAHYPSKFLPEHRWGQWDPVAVLVQAARKHGLQVQLCVPVLACGHDRPAGILKQHPDWALCDDNGQPIGTISPGHPQARQWIADWLGELVQRYQPDGLLLDYLRYASQPTQLDPASADRFTELSEVSPADNRAGQLQQFREDLLTELMGMISQRLRSQQSDLQLAIYSWGHHVTSGHRVGQAWPQWAARGYIDEVNISGYWYPESFSKRFGDTHIEAFRNAIRGAQELLTKTGSDTRLTFALGIKTSHGKVDSIDDIETYLQHGKALGVDGAIIFTWTYLQPFLPQLQQAGILGEFAARPPVANPANATLLVATADSSNRAKRQADFVGDGHGDQEQINAAIAKLPSVGGTVQLAEGTYDICKVADTLGGIVIDRSDVVLAGRGAATKLVQAAGQNTNVIRIIGSGVHHVTIRDLLVDANRDQNNQGQGDANISHDRFEFCGIKGFCRDPRGPAADDLHNITVRNCEVRNAHRLGIMLEGANLQVIDNVLGNAGSDSVELLTGPGMIRGNYVEITEQTHVAIGSDRANSIQMSDNIVHVKQGGRLDIGFRTWAKSQRHVIHGNVLIVDAGGHCELAMDLRGQMHTVTGNTIDVLEPNSTTKLRIGGGNTIVSGNLLKQVLLEVNDTYGDQKPIRIVENVLDRSSIELISGNLLPPAAATP